jgi:hypothetical protein
MAQVFRVPMQLDLVALSFIAIEYRSLWTIGLLCKTSSTRRKTLGEVWCNSWPLKTTVRNVLGIRLWFIVGNITLKQPIFVPGASRWNNILFRDIFFLFSLTQYLLSVVSRRFAWIVYIVLRLQLIIIIIIIVVVIDLVLQLDARPWRIRFTNLWIFLALRLFRWTMYCVMLFSLLFCFLKYFYCSFVFTPVLAEIGPSSCWVSTIKLRI